MSLLRKSSFTAGAWSLVFAGLPATLAGAVRPAHPDHGPEKLLPSPAGVPAEYQPFLARGQQARLSEGEIRALLKDFEGALAAAYGVLGAQLSPLLKKQTLTAEETALIANSSSKAAGLIADATRDVLKPLGLSAREMSSLIPNYYYFSTATKSAIKKAYPDTTQDMRDEVSMPVPLSFIYLMAGLSRRAGVYMDVESDKRAIAGSFLMNFPAYYFSHGGTEKKVPLRDDISRFLQAESMRSVADKLYDPNVKAFTVVALPTSAAYTLDGAADNYGTYGMNDPFEGSGKILIYEGNIRHRARKLADTWRVHLQDSVEIHEFMHALHRTRQPACLLSRENKAIAAALDEAQAQAAALGVLAYARNVSLNYVLTIKRNTGWSATPDIVYNDFYNGILQRVLQRRFRALRAEPQPQAPLEAGKLPAYFQIAQPVTPAKGATGAAPFALGLLKVGTAEAHIVSDIDHLEPAARMDLLFDATAQDVLEQAHGALAKVVELEAQLCR